MSNTKQIIITLNAKSLFDYFPKKPKTNFSKSAFRFCTARELRWYFSNKAAVLERFAPDKFCH